MNKFIENDLTTMAGEEGVWSAFEGASILVTGATGMVGGYLASAILHAARLRGLRTEVIALTRRPRLAEAKFREFVNQPGFRLLPHDVNTALPKGINVDYVVHAGSPADPAAFRAHPTDTALANVVGTANTIALAAAQAARYCFISSIEVYGSIQRSNLPGAYRVHEDDVGTLAVLDPRSAYPQSKRLGETLCAAAQLEFGLDFTTVRLSHTYGPGMTLGDSRVQAEFARKALAGQDIVLKSDGSLLRTYTYIADAISAILRVMGSGQAGSAYNVANSAALVTIKELAELTVAAAPRHTSRVLLEPAHPGDPMWSRSGVLLVDTGRTEALGWTPRYGLAEGLARWMNVLTEEYTG